MMAQAEKEEMSRGALRQIGSEGLKALMEKWKGSLDPGLDERLASLPTRLNEHGFDPFGFCPEFVKYPALWAMWLYKKYFRVEAHGIENVPQGRALLIANHSGQIPIDGAMITVAMLLDGKPPRMLRGMVERWVPTLPFVSIFFTRCGQVVGTPENCRRLLENEEAILVFPEGSKGVTKTFDKRYQLQEFGQGFMRIALENKAPIVPVAVVGAEEQAPSLYDFKPLARLLGFPAFPITPTWPLLLPFGLIPLPSKYRIYFGEPMRFSGDPGEEDREIEEKAKAVKSAIATLIRLGLKERKHIFW